LLIDLKNLPAEQDQKNIYTLKPSRQTFVKASITRHDSLMKGSKTYL